MKKGMCITYEVGTGLYVNITNRCSNRCDFCIRNNGDGAYGSDSLWLSHEPTYDEIVESVFSRDMTKYTEVVFCGYGEPTYRLDTARQVALEIKKRTNLPVRINTNGHTDLINSSFCAEKFAFAFDTVSISLNAPSKERYNDICHPVYDNDAFDAVISFAQNVKKYVQNVCFTVVREFLYADELSACRALSKKLGIPLKVRDYISQ